jgi:hypothetical protein
MSTRTTPLNHLEVTINKTYEKDQTPKMSGSLIIVEGQVCDKPARQPTLVGNDVNVSHKSHDI